MLEQIIQLGKPPAMLGDSIRFDRSGGHLSGNIKNQQDHPLPLAGGGLGRG